MELPPLVSPPLNRFEDPFFADCRRPQVPTLELIAGLHDAMVVMAEKASGRSETCVTIW
jgi:hypothetical protein